MAKAEPESRLPPKIQAVVVEEEEAAEEEDEEDLKFGFASAVGVHV